MDYVLTVPINTLVRRFIKMDWILRFVKGIFIGTGFILPGVSGGALAAVFGIYERIISFLAHITKDFKKNVLFFIPVGLGGIAGIFLLSFALSFFLGSYETQILWFFIGCIVGTIPTLWKQAGKEGRSKKHYVLLAIVFIFSFLFLLYGANAISGNVTQNFATWMIAGALIGLGVVVPGLSPSNFLLYMGMYKDMVDGVKDMNLMIIIPIGLGAVICVLLFSKLMDLIFRKAYAGLFHCILGVVFSSTIMIIPTNFNYFSFGTIICAILCFAGALLGSWMGTLEEKYKPEQ